MTVFFLLHTSTMPWVPSLKGTSNALVIVYNRHMLQFLHTYTYVSGILIFHEHNVLLASNLAFACDQVDNRIEHGRHKQILRYHLYFLFSEK